LYVEPGREQLHVHIRIQRVGHVLAAEHRRGGALLRDGFEWHHDLVHVPSRRHDVPEWHRDQRRTALRLFRPREPARQLRERRTAGRPHVLAAEWRPLLPAAAAGLRVLDDRVHRCSHRGQLVHRGRCDSSVPGHDARHDVSLKARIRRAAVCEEAAR
jgi:hypothetical protein